MHVERRDAVILAAGSVSRHTGEAETAASLAKFDSRLEAREFNGSA